jgi:hypothetical protein
VDVGLAECYQASPGDDDTGYIEYQLSYRNAPQRLSTAITAYDKSLSQLSTRIT